MKKSYLLPRGFKKVGMVLAVCCLAWFTVNCLTDESLDFKFKTFALIGETPFAHASGDSSQSSSSLIFVLQYGGNEFRHDNRSRSYAYSLCFHRFFKEQDRG